MLLRNSTFNIFRSSFIGCFLPFEVVFIGGCLPFEVVFHLRLSSIWGRLPLEIIFHWRSSSFQALLILVWSPELKFKIWGRSNQWLLRYSTFNILRSSSIGGCLYFKHFWFWFGPLSLSLKFEEDPISGCWDIPLLIFWGRLPSRSIRGRLHFKF